MDRSEWQDIYAKLSAELETVDAERKRLEQRRMALVQAINGIQGLTGGDSIDAISTISFFPRGKEALLLLMRETPGREWTVNTFVDELSARGWMPNSDNPKAVLRVTLRRLVDDRPDEITKPRDGVYVYRPPRISAVLGASN